MRSLQKLTSQSTANICKALNSCVTLTATVTSAFNGPKLFCIACRLISYIHPARSKELLDELQKKHMTVLGKSFYQSQ